MLRLLTFNVLQLPFISASPRGWRRAGWAVDAVRAVDPDVIVLNEAFALSAAGRLVSRLKRRGYHASPQIGALRGRRGWDGEVPRVSPVRTLVGGGVRVLSRYPFRWCGQHLYSAVQRKTQDALSAKGVALVELDTPDGRVWLAATHLQADEPPTPVSATRAVRLEQLKELREFVARTAPPEAPVLLVGDLNVEYYAADARGVPGDRGQDLDDAADAVGGRLEPDGDMHEHTFDSANNRFVARSQPGYRNVLDYVGSINENGLRPVPRITTCTVPLRPRRPASDHFPVVANVTLGPA
ncbi:MULTISPECIES: sphingomyelin phosphodiesterase [Amycolatopsis]|uniref:Endonuclease/exonuclease/phosphatase family metal-dependent hydrolase n=1 Tax=Amycolatopsis echigonensis TaxID=2576905 RepID=A0A2N3WNJ3_9PSEU|nr:MULTISPECIES: sphingomyelin phosphodiesterase [Amycolatopsis]PKV95432.1 endonuclease/exonuclease/phosphatase family metal-dependent hydrolase [Amycolatopsis niigatensis]